MLCFCLALVISRKGDYPRFLIFHRSVIWLHDGVWIPSEVEERDIRFAESVMLQAFSVRSEGETLLHVCQLGPYADYLVLLLLHAAAVSL